MKKAFIFCLLISFKPALQVMAQPYLPETVIGSLSGITNMHDVVVNCDMLQESIEEGDDHGTFKAIVWDNGERFATTGNQSESWLYVEDQYGNAQSISMGINYKQPDVVIANAIDPQDGNPTYIVGVVFVHEQPTAYTLGRVTLNTYGVYNVGTTSLSVSLLTSTPLGNSASYMAHGTEDGNPHIDMWTDANNLVNGLPSLREFAISWSEGYSYTLCPGAPPLSPTLSPGELRYTYGDINTPWLAPGNTVNGFSINGMNDIACYYSVDEGLQYVVITYGGATPCSPKYGLYATDIVKGASLTAGATLDTKVPVITRVEAMSQYVPGHLKWLVVASVPQPTGPYPWEVYSYDEFANSNFLSSNYSTSVADLKSPAVAGGVGPLLNSNIGNTQFTTGYYPRDYNIGVYNHIYSQGVDVYTGAMSGELQVDNNGMNYDWDISRIYATASSSNSGYNILSAYHDGADIIYKESPNSFVYKQGNTTSISNGPSQRMGIGLYPNPAHDRLHITRAEHAIYSISSITGTIVAGGKNSSAGINISELPSGMYLVKLKEENQKVTTLKFVKN